jgi:hypothetical protein
MSQRGAGSNRAQARSKQRVNEGRVLCSVENGLDERSTVGPLVEHGDDDSLVGHDDLESAHIAISEGNGGHDLCTGPAWLLG